MQARMSRSDASTEKADSEVSSSLAQSAHLTYEKGSVLSLRAQGLGDGSLTVRVSRIYRPISSSCVMSVEILDGARWSESMPTRAVLKLYDRRFASSLRREHKVDTWNPRTEEDFLDFVNSGRAADFMNGLETSDYLAEPASGWSTAESETYLQYWCSGMRDNELEVYQHLEGLQGGQIPQLYTSVTLLPDSPTTDVLSPAARSSSLLEVPGLLMEHIIGHKLVQIPDFVSSDHWQPIVDEALKTIHVVSDHDVINEGIKASNMIASSKSGRHRVVMVDFSRCAIRSARQSNMEWGRLKADLDEEGTVGRTMSKVLKKVRFDLRYVPSNRFQQFKTGG